MKFLQCSGGSKERLQKYKSDLMSTRQKNSKQINHNLSVKPHLVSFTEQKSFLSPNLLCKQTFILLK